MKEPAIFNDVIYKRRNYQRVFEFDYDITTYEYAGGLLAEAFIPFVITKLDAYRLMIELSKVTTGSLEAKSKFAWDMKEVSGELESPLIKGVMTIEDSVTL